MQGMLTDVILTVDINFIKFEYYTRRSLPIKIEDCTNEIVIKSNTQNYPNEALFGCNLFMLLFDVSEIVQTSTFIRRLPDLKRIGDCQTHIKFP